MTDIIEIIRGDDVTLTFTFTDQNNAAVDLTGSTVFFTVKLVVDDDVTDALAVISEEQTVHTNATGGITQITLTDTVTTLISPATYKWDVQVKDSGGLISSARSGEFRVFGDITRRTT